MGGSANRRQIGLVLSHEDDDLLRAMHKAVDDEMGERGGSITISGYVMRLVRDEAKRLDVLPQAKKAATHAKRSR